MQIPTHSEAARIAVLLNSRELRRDPWNMSLPTEIVQYDGATDTAQVSPTTATKGHFGADRDGATATSDWTFLMQRTCGPSSENAYYRPWNDPPLATIRDCFNLAQQLLEVRHFDPSHSPLCPWPAQCGARDPENAEGGHRPRLSVFLFPPACDCLLAFPLPLITQNTDDLDLCSTH